GGGGGLAPGLRSATLSGGGFGEGMDGGFGSGFGSGGTSGSSGTSGRSASRTGSSSGTSSGRSTATGGASSSSASGTASGFGSGLGSGGGLSLGGGSGTSRSSSGLGGGFGTGGGGGGQGENAIRITADTANNALVIYAPPFEYESIEKLIKELDVMPLQVLVDAMIMEISLTDELRYGVQWAFQHSGGRGEGALGPLNGVVADAASAAGGFGYHFIAKNVQASMEALADKSKINVLSAPSLMVLNNQQAIIKVGDQVPILTSASTPTTGGADTNPIVTNTVQMRDTGVQLQLRPRVNKGGLVTMDIQQMVDDVKETDSSNIDSPTIAQRQIQSSIAVKDGDTIVLGGLIKDTHTSANTGIPVLKDIPILGALFSTTRRSVDRTELIVLITPHVAEDRSQAISVTEEYKARLKGLADDGSTAPWYR
ncbi:MAG TPA: secretin N-terminal domain-containing protein, partial [Methylococcaceae bacterium]|nr:secretin N-terminal domain-containing protein [Methylococcaceae bacterium]